jgi:2-keto-4-pentenoate hydratase/2-oxohepta-3-ene-1,7-dioic acid hydratase in catechol pathway
MKLANYDGRPHLVVADGVIDVAAASGGRWTGPPGSIFDNWVAFRDWASEDPSAEPAPFDASRLGAPSPAPRQVFAIGLNYAAHAAEGGMEPPTVPPTFTKYLSSLVGPFGEVVLPSASVDWEVELVVVIGLPSTRVQEAQAWSHVAGLTVGQDLSDRAVQFMPPAPQFSLGKSFPGFGPTGPFLVTPDELDDPDDLALGCSVNGETMQDGRTSDLIFSVSRLVAHLSSVVTLHPGDLIFTGTPSGVGVGRKPPRFLQPGDELDTWIEGVGEMRHQLVAPPEEAAR